jgi:hypothetical protein
MSLNDQQLEELAKRLGASAGMRLDLGQTASAVVERLKSEPETVVWWRRQMPVFGAVAAAAVMVLAIGILAHDSENKSSMELDLVLTPVELQALSIDELKEVFDSLSFEAPVYELAVASLDDMSIGQLEELLQTMMED